MLVCALIGLVARMSGSSQDVDIERPLVPLYVTLTFSVLGFVATFVFYILTAKCIQCSCLAESLLEKCCGAISCTERESEDQQQSLSCCSSSAGTKVLTVLQLCAKLLLALANILYIGLLLFVIGGSIVSMICAAWEFVVIFIIAVVRVCCWLYRVWRKYEEPSLWGFLEYLRFGDLQITSFLVPFGNDSLFDGHLWWLLVGIIRLAFYVITFITDVVIGVRSDCCCSVTSGRGNNLRNIKFSSYVVTRMVMKLIEIGLKLAISSSAIVVFPIATAGLVSTTAGLSSATGIAYIIFTVLSGLTAFVTLWFSAIGIRWEAVQKGGTTQVEDGTEMREKSDDKDDDKEDNVSTSCCAGVIDCLKKRQPHVHAIFVLDMVTYGGFIVLNVYIAANQ